MRHTLSFLFLFFFLNVFASDTTSRLLSFQLYKTVTKSDLEERLKKNHVPASLVNAHYDVNVYDVKYKTCWHDGTCVLASGLYFVPVNYTEPSAQVVYHHGTRVKGGRSKNLGSEEFVCVGMAVDGYSVLMPDYLGLGYGEKFHLYQMAEPLGQTTADMLYAIRELNDSLHISTNEQLFLTGYSEGGYAALAANKLLQEKYRNDFKVTAAAPNSGAYDMAGVQGDVMFKEYSHPHYLPYLLRAFNEVYQFAPGGIQSIYKPPYDTIIPNMFDGKHDIKAIDKLLPKVPKDMLLDSLVDDFVKNPESPMRRALADNSLCDWKPENPVQFCYCKNDEQVSYKNALVTKEKMKKAGAKHITLRSGGNKYGHYKCGIFAAMYSKLYFDSFRNGSKYGRRGNLNTRFLLSLAKLAIKP